MNGKPMPTAQQVALSDDALRQSVQDIDAAVENGVLVAKAIAGNDPELVEFLQLALLRHAAETANRLNSLTRL